MTQKNTHRNFFYIFRHQGDLLFFLRHAALCVFYFTQNAVYYFFLYNKYVFHKLCA